MAITDKFLPLGDGYKIGDILKGYFPADDGRKRVLHYAVVYDRVGETPLVRALIGTSQHLPPHDGRARPGLLVLWGADDKENWPSLGLEKPTMFDFQRGLDVATARVRHGLTPVFEEDAVGTLADSEVWSLMLDQARRYRRQR